MKQWFALQREDEVKFFHDGAVEDEPAQTEEPTKVSSVLDRSDDAASQQDGSIEKVAEAQECNGMREQDVTILREKWSYNEMEKKKRDKCFEFLKHFWNLVKSNTTD